MPPFVGLVWDMPGRWPAPASQSEIDGLEDLTVPGCSEEADNPLRASLFVIHICASPKLAVAAGFYSRGGAALLHQVKLATSVLQCGFSSGWRAGMTNSRKDLTKRNVQETRPQEGQRMQLCVWQPTQNEGTEITFSEDTSY